MDNDKNLIKQVLDTVPGPHKMIGSKTMGKLENTGNKLGEGMSKAIDWIVDIFNKK